MRARAREKEREKERECVWVKERTRERAPQNYRSLLQKSLIKETIFCKRENERKGA